jgi:hypothetical protein
MREHHRFSSIDTDYFQFHLHDTLAECTLADAWTPEALERNLAVAPFIVAVGTHRNISVWLDVEKHDTEPEWRESQHWAQVLECSLDIPSGDLAVSSPTLPPVCYNHIALTPGCYRLRVHYGKQSRRGVHRYLIVLWHSPSAPITLLKERQ